MPAHLLIFVIFSLGAVLFMRRMIGTVLYIPSVFLHLALGLGLGAVARSDFGVNTIPVLRDTAALQSISFIGWVGCLLLLALGTSANVDKSNGGSTTRQAVSLSTIGFSGTFICASSVSYLLGERFPHLLGAHATHLSFALAIGLACAVTALPVLVSLLHESKQENSFVGQLAIRVAVLDDVWLWLALSVITGLFQVQANPWLHGFKIIALVLMSRLMLRPLLAFLKERRWVLTQNRKVLVALSAITTMSVISEYFGAHALFGAFLAGWSMPKSLLNTLRTNLLPIANTFFVPFFFISTGMSIELSFSNSDFLLLALFFTLMGTSLKMGIVSVTAYSQGIPWTDACRLGALLQCKGLMEIVVLGLLRDAQVIGLQVYSALIVMALTCTALTAPLQALIATLSKNFSEKRKEPVWPN
jgi:Kef-type K+ transport system membrane component KefB